MTRAEKFMKCLKQPKLQPKTRQKVLSMSGSTTTTPQAKTKESKKIDTLSMHLYRHDGIWTVQ
jgi:hypothetical protein